MTGMLMFLLGAVAGIIIGWVGRSHVYHLRGREEDRELMHMEEDRMVLYALRAYNSSSAEIRPIDIRGMTGMTVERIRASCERLLAAGLVVRGTDDEGNGGDPYRLLTPEEHIAEVSDDA